MISASAGGNTSAGGLADHGLARKTPEVFARPVDQDVLRSTALFTKIADGTLSMMRSRKALFRSRSRSVAALFGDVFYGGDPAAAFHGLIDDAKRVPSDPHHFPDGGLALAQLVMTLGKELVRVAAECSGGLAMLEEIEKRKALQILGALAHHFAVAALKSTIWPSASNMQSP